MSKFLTLQTSIKFSAAINAGLMVEGSAAFKATAGQVEATVFNALGR